jgi:pimeloyl-ACP methyl ester carboxylesterase
MKLELNNETVFIGTGSRPLADPAAATVVFVHGAGMDHSVWVMPARYFARQGFRVIAPDLPGHGRSSGEPLDNVEAMADWLDELAEALKVSSMAVVGHSMGSLIACTLAARHPQRVRQLILLGTSAPMSVSERLLDAARDNHPAAVTMANTWSHARGRLGGNANPGMWMMAGGARLIERSDPGVFHTDLAACNGYDPETVEQIGAPAVVIAGSADQMTPAAAGRQVFAALDQQAGARLVELPGSGHSMLSEYPNEVLDALAAALNT